MVRSADPKDPWRKYDPKKVNSFTKAQTVGHICMQHEVSGRKGERERETPPASSLDHFMHAKVQRSGI